MSLLRRIVFPTSSVSSSSLRVMGANQGRVRVSKYFSTSSLTSPALPLSSSSSSCPSSSCCSEHDMHARVRLLYTKTNSTTPTPPPLPASPEEALNLLRKGNQRFINGDVLALNRSLERVKSLSAAQTPFASFLACADSRVPVELIFDQGFGDLFVNRVAGNIVTTELCASLEFGSLVLGSKVIYVLGHTQCGAVNATLAKKPVPGVISSLYYHIHAAVSEPSPASSSTSLPPSSSSSSSSSLTSASSVAVINNVRFQVRQLLVSPVLRSLVDEGKLIVVGGVYDLATGQVTEIPI